MLSNVEFRKIDENLLVQLTDEWLPAREIAKRAGCSMSTARDRLIRLAEVGLCQRSVRKLDERAHATIYVYRAVTTPAVAAARNDD